MQSDGQLQDIEKAMYVDGIGTVGGALLGTSSIITFVESAVGIAMHGRTGVVAIVCGTLMLASLFITPLVGLVPVQATAGVLCYVGYLLLPLKREKLTISETVERKDRYTEFDIFVSVVMGIISFATFSLDKAMLFGFVAYTLRNASKKDYNPYLIVSTLLVILSVVLQYLLK